MKHYQFLKELLPGVKRVGHLQDPSPARLQDPNSPLAGRRWNERVRSVGIEVHDLDVKYYGFDPRVLLSQQRGCRSDKGSPLAALPGPINGLSLTWQHNTSCPRFISNREFVENGGLISYGVSYPHHY